MASEMVERVALAIARVIGGKSGNQMSDWITPARLEEARAAIEAMREPTTPMVTHAAIAEAEADDDSRPFVRTWQAMIDAALA